MYSTNPELQIEIEKLVAVMTATATGETVTYAALKAATSGNYKPWALIKARELVERETGARLAAVHGVGIKRLAASDVAGLGVDARRRVGKIAKRTSARLTGLSYNDLTDDDRAKVNMERSLLGAVHALASGKAAAAVAPNTRTGPEVASAVLSRVAEAVRG